MDTLTKLTIQSPGVLRAASWQTCGTIREFVEEKAARTIPKLALDVSCPGIQPQRSEQWRDDMIRQDAKRF